MSRYKCHKCESEHGTDNMVAYCAACYASLRSKLAEVKRNCPSCGFPDDAFNGPGYAEMKDRTEAAESRCAELASKVEAEHELYLSAHRENMKGATLLMEMESRLSAFTKPVGDAQIDADLKVIDDWGGKQGIMPAVMGLRLALAFRLARVALSASEERAATAKAERESAWTAMAQARGEVVALQKRCQDAETRLSALTEPVGEKDEQTALIRLESQGYGAERVVLERALRQARAELVEEQKMRETLVGGLVSKLDASNRERDLALFRLAESEKVVKAAKLWRSRHTGNRMLESEDILSTAVDTYEAGRAK